MPHDRVAIETHLGRRELRIVDEEAEAVLGLTKFLLKVEDRLALGLEYDCFKYDLQHLYYMGINLKQLQA